MKTKEAIKWVKNIPKIRFYLAKNGKIMMTNRFKDCTEKEYYNDINDIVTLLKRGGKYEEILKDIENINKGEFVYYTQIDEIKQKYFPKPSADFTEKVMEKIRRAENETI